MNDPHTLREKMARYYAGECNEEEMQQLLEECIENYGFLDECKKDAFTPDVELALKKVHRRMSQKKTKRLYLCIAAAVAILFLFSIIGIQYVEMGKEYVTETQFALKTGIGETLDYELPDGSKVSLNQGSSLRYPEVFAENTREVYLDGEAFFDVAPDAAKPFIIHANQTRTEVVGTSFGIKALENTNAVVVTVSTGTVSLTGEGMSGHIELNKGEQGFCILDKKVLEKNADPDLNLLAWKTKILTFKQTPLAEVANVIKNAYQTVVDVDPSVSGLQLTATFEKRSLEEVMQIIEKTLQIQAQPTGKGFLMKSE